MKNMNSLRQTLHSPRNQRACETLAGQFKSRAKSLKKNPATITKISQNQALRENDRFRSEYKKGFKFIDKSLDVPSTLPRHFMNKYFHMFHIDKSDICTLKNPKLEMIEKLN